MFFVESRSFRNYAPRGTGDVEKVERVFHSGEGIVGSPRLFWTSFPHHN